MSEAETTFNSTLGEYYMKISIGDYVRPKPFVQSTWAGNKKIILPLPTELRDDTAVNYVNQDLKTVGDIINGAYSGAIGSIALAYSGKALSDLGSTAAGAIAGGIAAGGAAAGASRSILGDKIGSAVQEGVSELFPADQLTSAIQQSSGMAPNPNPSVAFAGPQLREFTYSWTLFPKSEQESRDLQKIIAILKQSALPQNVMSGAASVLKYPKMCQINFYPWDNNTEGQTEWGWGTNSIIKHKKCFLGAVNVSYTPSNVPAFFYSGNKNPVAVQLTISFKEIEYFMSHDWGGTQGDNGLLEGVLGPLLGVAADQVEQAAVAGFEAVTGIFSSDAQAPSEDPTQAADNG